jgi:hypothetical protein
MGKRNWSKGPNLPTTPTNQRQFKVEAMQWKNKQKVLVDCVKWSKILLVAGVIQIN